jgi:hypothetical protein
MARGHRAVAPRDQRPLGGAGGGVEEIEGGEGEKRKR